MYVCIWTPERHGSLHRNKHTMEAVRTMEPTGDDDSDEMKCSELFGTRPTPGQKTLLTSFLTLRVCSYDLGPLPS